MSQGTAIAYQTLLKDLRFDYYKNDGTVKHHYAQNSQGAIRNEKLTRIAQELADLSNAMPYYHTNAIYI